MKFTYISRAVQKKDSPSRSSLAKKNRKFAYVRGEVHQLSEEVQMWFENGYSRTSSRIDALFDTQGAE